MKTYNERLPLIGDRICIRQEFEQRVKEREAMKVIDYYRENYDWDYKEDGSCTLTPKIVSKKDWYESGELPPVGEVCRYYSRNSYEWRECTVVAHWKSFAIIVDNENDKTENAYDNLRPLRTKEDELLAQAKEDVQDDQWLFSKRELVRKLIKAGWRPTNL